MKCNFEINGKTCTLTVNKGNAKPIPEFVWNASMQSGQRCYCRLNDLCPIADDCYTRPYEENGMMGKNTLACREIDEECIDELVALGMGGAHMLANELVRRHKLARTHKCKFFRWNVSGDLKSIDYFFFVDTVAWLLNHKIGTISVIYTHREDLWEEFQYIRLKGKHLIVNGSGFMADNMFDAVEEFSEDEEVRKCTSNCKECFEENGTAFCYDINNTGVVIEEKFRPYEG